MLTKADFDQLEKKLTTKEELNRAVEELMDFIQTTNQATISQITAETDQIISELRYYTKEISSVIKNHKSRIQKLENIAS